VGDWVRNLAGLILPRSGGGNDQRPVKQPARVIPGGGVASELCMLPVEWDGLDAAAADERDTWKRDVRVAQIKADGINAVALPGMIVGGRDGGPLDCALQALPALSRLQATYGEPMAFFGEYVAHDGFNATLAEHRKGVGDGAFWLYDAMPHAAWMSGRPYEVSTLDRLQRLKHCFLATEPGLFLGMLDFWLLDAGEMRAKAREVWAAGFEGLVSKDRAAGYVRGRSPAWRKVKERVQASCPVVDTIEKDGRLHSIIVRGPSIGGVSKPLRVTGGWSAGDAECIRIGMSETGAGRDVLVEFGLTTGTTRSIRSPKFAGIVA